MSEVQIDRLILDLNRLALENLTKGNPKACLQLLLRAQDLLATPNFPESKNWISAITFNNLGCYYKSIKNLNLALSAFQKAFDSKSDEILEKSQAAEIHLNVCFIKEAFSQYDALLYHSKNALQLINQAENPRKDLSPLAFLYIGKALKGLDQPAQASKFFKQGLEIANKELNHTHKITGTLLQAYLEVSTKPTVQVPLPKYPGSVKSQTPSKMLNESYHIISNSNLNAQSTRRQSKKHIFEHLSARTPDSEKRSSDVEIKKITPIKGNSKIMDGVYFDDGPKNKPRSCERKNCRASQVAEEEKKNRKTCHSASRSRRIIAPARPETSMMAQPPSRMKSVKYGKVSTREGQNKTMYDIEIMKGQTDNHHRKNADSGPVRVVIDRPLPKLCHESSLTIVANLNKHNRPESFSSLRKKTQVFEKKAQNIVDKVLMIQRFWRKYQVRKNRKKKKMANEKAQKAVEEFEELKKLAMMENFELTDIEKMSLTSSQRAPVLMNNRGKRPVTSARLPRTGKNNRESSDFRKNSLTNSQILPSGKMIEEKSRPNEKISENSSGMDENKKIELENNMMSNSKNLTLIDNSKESIEEKPLTTDKILPDAKKIKEKSVNDHAIIIQKNIRRYLAVEKYRHIKKLTIRLQRWYRMISVKHLYQSIRN